MVDYEQIRFQLESSMMSEKNTEDRVLAHPGIPFAKVHWHRSMVGLWKIIHDTNGESRDVVRESSDGCSIDSIGRWWQSMTKL